MTTGAGRNTTQMRLVHFWRIAWTVGTLLLVEIIVCGLSALPVVFLWLQLARFLASSPCLQTVVLSGALIPSHCCPGNIQ